jgi:hypothetical protein
MLIIDAFDRLAGPQPIETDSTVGFNMDLDPGVPMARMPGYSGRQLNFDKALYGREGSNGLGFCGTELEGKLIAGNTLDWSTRHARDIIAASGGRITISSLAQEAVRRSDFDSRHAGLIDLIFGLERRDGYSLRSAKVMDEPLTQAVAEFVRRGGSVVASGAYVGSDMHSDKDRLITRTIFKYEYAGTLCADSVQGLSGMRLNPDFRRGYCEREYGTPFADCLAPVSPAFCTMVYTPTQECAAVAYQGKDYRAMTFGFPLETVKDGATRVKLWKGILSFLLP